MSKTLHPWEAHEDARPPRKIGSVAWWTTSNTPFRRDRHKLMEMPTRIAGHYYRDRMVWPNMGPNRQQRRAAGLR